MAIPTSDNLYGTDYSLNGEPFVDFPTKSIIILGNMDYSTSGEPFVRNEYPSGGGVGPTNIKTWCGVSLANIKTFNGVAIANVKTIDGVA